MKKNSTLFILFLIYLMPLPAQQNIPIQKKLTLISCEITNSAPKIWVADVNSGSIGLYEKFEISIGLDSAIYNNPYDPDQIDVRAIFTSPSGKTWNIFGFYDNYLNVSQWKIRFAPNEVGEWSYYLTAKDANGLGQSDTYLFNAIASPNHGWIRVSAYNPRYLEQSDGTSFFGVGMCYPWNVHKSGLSRLASFGANIFFYWNGTYDSAGNGGGRNLIESLNSGLGRYDQHKSARLDELIKWSEELNIGMVLVIWPHDYFCDQFTGWPAGWNSNPYKSLCPAKDIYANQQAYEYQEKQYRYIIARWGYSRALAAWQIICEITGTDGWEFGDHAVAEQWSQKVHDYFKTNDPFNHPTTGSQHGYVTCDWPKGYEIFDLPNREIYEWQGFSYDPKNKLRSSYQNYVRITRQIWNGYQKPVISGETGYSLTFVEAGTPEYVELYHNALWATFAAGMAGTPFWWAYGGDNIVTEEVLKQMQTFSRFIKSIDFAHIAFEPAEVQTADCDAFGMKSDSLACGWIRQIDNLNVSGKSFTLKGMDDGAYFIKWFNTWTGSEIYSQLVISFNQTITTTTPAISSGKSDMAFIIFATEPGASPAALELFADKTSLFNDLKDTATVTCVIKDEQGRLCVNASNEIHFDFYGSGSLIDGQDVNAVNGIATVKILSDSTTGTATIVSSSAGLISDTVKIVIRNNLTIDDFEGYATADHLQSYWVVYSGTQTTVSLDLQNKESGSRGMKVDYSIGAPVFAGIYRNINADWRRFAYLRAWIKPDGSRRNLAVMLKESSGKIWHFNYPLSGTKSEVLTIPFQDFRLYLGSGEMDLKEINQLILYLTKGTGENGSGSIYLDNFEVLISPATSLDFSLTPMMPEKFALFQNYPNPFNRVTAISYQLLTSSEIELSLFDLLGRKIKTLVQQKQNAGDYSIDCDASELASGIYLYQIRAGDFVQAKKMILIR